jgi:hypothetical protein
MPCSPGMAGCHRGCLHRRFVQDYRIERHRQELAREDVTGGYEAEEADHPPIITFKKWLIDHAGMSAPDDIIEDDPYYGGDPYATQDEEERECHPAGGQAARPTAAVAL